MNLTETQLAAIKDSGSFLAVTAGAGSGKTKVLVERISGLIEEKRAGLDEILAITFTDKAAAELKERIYKLVKDDVKMASSHIGTFHSFCTSVLREHAPILGIDPDFSVMEEHSSGILIRKAAKKAVLTQLENKNSDVFRFIEELDFRNAVSCIEELMRFRWHAKKLIPPEFQILDFKLSAAISCFKEAAGIYSSEKGTKLDFQDLEILAIELFGKKDVCNRYQRRFKYIFVDEFQDVNDTQACLVGMLHNPKLNSLTIVGDEKQSIYGFRGANVREFGEALKRAEKTVALKENFRSRPGIISFVNFVFPEFEPLAAVREPVAGGGVFVISISSQDDAKKDDKRRKEADAVADLAQNLEGSTACLFSSLKSAKIYRKALLQRGVPFVVHGGGGLLGNQHIIDIVNALRVANNKNDLVALVGLARSPFIGLTDEELFLLRRSCASLFEGIKSHPKGGFLKKLEAVARHLSISELIGFVGGKSDNVNILAGIAEEIEKSEKILLADFLDYISEIRSKDNGISEYPAFGKNAVFLMTIHQAKGLEFDNVILCDTVRGGKNGGQKWQFSRGEKSSLTFSEKDEAKKIEQKAERDRLLYVAMTRARERLIIPIHKDASRDGPWHKLLAEKCSATGVQENPPSPCGRELEGGGAIKITFISPLPNPLPQGERAIVDAGMTNRSNAVFTVSELETLARSKEEYKKRYILKTPELPLKFDRSASLPANIHGDIVHRLIELKKHGQDLRELLNNVLVEMEISKISEAEREEIIAKAERAGSKNTLNEVPFMMSIGDYFITGKLDALAVNASGAWEIIDYKTGHGENAADYDLQVRTYALAVSKKYGNNGKVTLVFLNKSGSKEVSVEISEKILKETETVLENLCSHL